MARRGTSRDLNLVQASENLLIDKDFVASPMPLLERYNAMQNMKQYQCGIFTISDNNGEPVIDPFLYCLLLNDITSINNFLITGEKNDQGIFHTHALIATPARTDSLRRSIRTSWEALTLTNSFIKQYGQQYTMDLIKLQKCNKPSSMAAYLVKNPDWVVADIEPHLQWAYDIDHWGQNQRFQAPSTSTSEDEDINKLTADIIHIIVEGNCKSLEDIMRHSPDVMKKYLHRPGLHAVVTNCLSWVKSTGGGWTLELFAKNDIDPETIHKVLLHQGIAPSDFDEFFHAWITKTSGKKNTLVLYGPSNTGKSAFISGLKSIVPWGEIVNTPTFAFEGLLDSQIGVWEEPLISTELAEKSKQIFEGMATSIAVKYRKPHFLPRIPILVTTNHHLWRFCTQEEDAFKNRMNIYTFKYSCQTYYYPRISEPSCECRYCRASRGGTSAHGSTSTHGMQGSGESIPATQLGHTSGSIGRTDQIPHGSSGSMQERVDRICDSDDRARSSRGSSPDQRGSDSTGSTISTSPSAYGDLDRRFSRDRPSDTRDRASSTQSSTIKHVESTESSGRHGQHSNGTRTSGKRPFKRRHLDGNGSDPSTMPSTSVMVTTQDTQEETSHIRSKKRLMGRKMGSVRPYKLDMFVPTGDDWKTYISYLWHIYG